MKEEWSPGSNAGEKWCKTEDRFNTTGDFEKKASSEMEGWVIDWSKLRWDWGVEVEMSFKTFYGAEKRNLMLSLFTDLGIFAHIICNSHNSTILIFIV